MHEDDERLHAVSRVHRGSGSQAATFDCQSVDLLCGKPSDRPRDREVSCPASGSTSARLLPADDCACVALASSHATAVVVSILMMGKAFIRSSQFGALQLAPG